MNKIIPSILLLTLAFTSVVSIAQYANPNINCDELIRTTYQNNARTNFNYVVTTENAQRCLADAGFYDYRGSNGKLLFTGKYWTETEKAAEKYLKIGENNDEAKKAEAAKAEAARLAEQEKINIQKKADELRAQTDAQNNANASTSATSATNNISNSASTQALDTTNKSQIAVGGTTPIQDSREPASADKFLMNSIYFLFALPFILFAISIIAAFLKVFKKPNE